MMLIILIIIFIIIINVTLLLLLLDHHRRYYHHCLFLYYHYDMVAVCTCACRQRRLRWRTCRRRSSSAGNTAVSTCAATRPAFQRRASRGWRTGASWTSPSRLGCRPPTTAGASSSATSCGLTLASTRACLRTPWRRCHTPSGSSSKVCGSVRQLVSFRFQHATKSK